MELFTEKIKETLLENGKQQEKVKGTAKEIDFYPVVRLFLPFTGASWLLTELDPHNQDIAFGLCDLGMGFPELGSVSISEITSIEVVGLHVERDTSFKADKPISKYALLAREHGKIVDESPGISRLAFE